MVNKSIHRLLVYFVIETLRNGVRLVIVVWEILWFTMAKDIQATTMTTNANELESKFVHHFYREVAAHFSDTRHKPWPKVAEFLTRLPRGSLVADVGMW